MNPNARITVDLRRLPRLAQYAIALTVTLLVVAAAWYVARDRVTPHWITAYLVPVLSWLGVILLVTGTIARVLRK